MKDTNCTYCESTLARCNRINQGIDMYGLPFEIGKILAVYIRFRPALASAEASTCRNMGLPLARAERGFLGRRSRESTARRRDGPRLSSGSKRVRGGRRGKHQ